MATTLIFFAAIQRKSPLLYSHSVKSHSLPQSDKRFALLSKMQTQFNSHPDAKSQIEDFLRGKTPAENKDAGENKTS